MQSSFTGSLTDLEVAAKFSCLFVASAAEKS
jgi:hypothetical protein